MSNIYSLRLYDTELMRFSLEKRGLDGLVAEVHSVQEECAPLMPLDLERTSEGIIRWLGRRVIPKNRTFVDQILKTLNLSHNDTKVVDGSGAAVGPDDGTYYTDKAGEIVLDGIEPGTTVIAHEIKTVEGDV